jgi:PKD repeat protein
VVFSAGNYGSSQNTVASPATAKNVIAVGAGENDRQTGSDGCGIGNAGANNWNDVISFSSRGPVNGAGGDGRWKPEITAPGTHVQAGVPQSNYGGGSVCNTYWPAGQTLYAWSSGTSHACPAVAGAAALVRQWFLNRALPAPSPAMVKAVILASGQHMTGSGGAGDLPSNVQGTGALHLPRAVGSAARILEDQTTVLGATGASHSVSGSVADAGQPFRVALVWTDAPGPASGAPYVNNLDLTVSVGGSNYRGNVFSGASSVPGGAADIRNNAELVFLPPGVSGPFTVTVAAASIGGDGVPGNADATDQDFALLIYNGDDGAPAAPVANFSGSPTLGPAPLTVSFTDLSSGSITARSWAFGDGGTSTAANPSHVYTTPGTYSVRLTVNGPGGSDALTRVDNVTVAAPPGSSVYYLSFTTGTSVPGLGAVADEDIVRYDPGTSSWTMYFDGSDVGLAGTDVDAFHVRANGSILLSLDATTSSVPGLTGGPSGTTVEDRDVVLFTPTSTGPTTAGSFSFRFDGSDVGLTSSLNEDIDALHELADGSLLISTLGNPTVGVPGASDEDVLRFAGSFGAATSGAFTLWFDGGDVGLAGGDVDGVALVGGTGLVISTEANASAGIPWNDEDLVRFTGTTGPATSGTFSMLLDLSTLGIAAAEGVDGVSIVP